MAEGYGDAVMYRRDDGTVVVERADDVIGISIELLAQADNGLPVDGSGCILLAGDPRYRYRPVRLDGLPGTVSSRCRVLVCERVYGDG